MDLTKQGKVLTKASEEPHNHPHHLLACLCTLHVLKNKPKLSHNISKFSNKKDIKSQEVIPQTLNPNYSYYWETCLFLFLVNSHQTRDQEKKNLRREGMKR